MGPPRYHRGLPIRARLPRRGIRHGSARGSWDRIRSGKRVPWDPGTGGDRGGRKVPVTTATMVQARLSRRRPASHRPACRKSRQPAPASAQAVPPASNIRLKSPSAWIRLLVHVSRRVTRSQSRDRAPGASHSPRRARDPPSARRTADRKGPRRADHGSRQERPRSMMSRGRSERGREPPCTCRRSDTHEDGPDDGWPQPPGSSAADAEQQADQD